MGKQRMEERQCLKIIAKTFHVLDKRHDSYLRNNNFELEI